MDVFQWDKEFETGSSEVDQQHQHLVMILNRFGAHVALNDLDAAAMEKVFEELAHYTQYHFAAEEKIMVSVGVNPEYLTLHQAEHQKFLQEVISRRQTIFQGVDNAGKQLLEYLVNWLIFHILGSDMSMARQIKAIERNTDALEAYRSEKKATDQSKDLLLTALNNLFDQVSDRNKELRELNQALEDKVEERTKELLLANQKLGELALTDVLTGLSNRRHAMLILDNLWVETLAKKTSLSCMMIDADKFKVVNDTCGHDAGDMVLCELSKRLRFAVRTDDIVCRMGGDEFLVILPNTDLDGALRVANQAQSEVAALSVAVKGGLWKGSISVGVAEKTELMQSIKDLIKAADLGVYAAKEAGKNCVRVADQ